MTFEEEFPLMYERWERDAPYDMGEDLKQAFRDCCLDKQRVREALEEIEHYIVHVQLSEDQWIEFKKTRLGL